MYELKEYLNAINHKKEDLMAGEDEFWEKKYPAYIVNKALSAFPDTLLYGAATAALPGMTSRERSSTAPCPAWFKVTRSSIRRQQMVGDYKPTITWQALIDRLSVLWMQQRWCGSRR